MYIFVCSRLDNLKIRAGLTLKNIFSPRLCLGYLLVHDMRVHDISRDGSHLSPEADWLLQFQISSGEAEDSANIEEDQKRGLAQPWPGSESEPRGEEETAGRGGLS